MRCPWLRVHPNYDTKETRKFRQDFTSWAHLLILFVSRHLKRYTRPYDADFSVSLLGKDGSFNFGIYQLSLKITLYQTCSQCDK